MYIITITQHGNFLLYCMPLSATSGINDVQREIGRGTILSIIIAIGLALAVIIVLVFLVLCIVRIIKRNKKQK